MSEFKWKAEEIAELRRLAKISESVVGILATELKNALRKIFEPEMTVIYQASGYVDKRLFIELGIRSDMHVSTSTILNFVSLCHDKVEVRDVIVHSANIDDWSWELLSYPLSSPTLFEDVLNITYSAVDKIISTEIAWLITQKRSPEAGAWSKIRDKINSRYKTCLQEAFECI